MTGVVCYASLRHYHEHLAPVVEALQNAPTPILRGVEAPRGRRFGEPLRRDRGGLLWLVASYADAQRVAPAPVILLEHGAGQSYHGDEKARRSGSYPGGEGLEHVVLFLCPNESVAQRWRFTYPWTPALVVGCPKLDRFHLQEQDEQHDDEDQDHQAGVGHGPTRTRGATVAVSFHWPNSLCPESQWALPHYRPVLHHLAATVRATGGQVIGHGHPRAWRQLRREWAHHGIEPVEHLTDVFARADLLAVDNSSAGPEFASLGRPVVWLSAPWYRRDVDHGARFWDWTRGVPHVEHPDDLADTVLATLADPAASADGREAMVTAAYAHRDGQAATRAAAAITEVCRTWETRSPPG